MQGVLISIFSLYFVPVASYVLQLTEQEHVNIL